MAPLYHFLPPILAFLSLTKRDNHNILQKTALALCKNADFGRRVSIQKKRFIAAFNPQKLFAILFADF